VCETLCAEFVGPIMSGSLNEFEAVQCGAADVAVTGDSERLCDFCINVKVTRLSLSIGQKPGSAMAASPDLRLEQILIEHLH